MPTSSTNPAWFQTVGQLCQSAAVELGALELGDTIEASEQAEMMVRLNSMLAKWSKDSGMWREASATITMLPTAPLTGAVTLPIDVRDIRSVRQIMSATYKRPLAPFNRDQFFQLPNRSQVGTPTIYYYSQQLDGDRLYVWPIPSTSQDFELDYNRAFFFAEAPEQTLDIPREWHEAALYGLAARCANMFGTTRTDPAAVQRVDAQARSSYQEFLDSDRPDSIFFSYDSPVESPA